MADCVKTSTWLSILNETRTFSESRKLREMTIIVVGGQECGKSSLVRSLNLNCTSTNGYSTDYGVTIGQHQSRDSDRSKVHLWCINGDGRSTCIDWQFQRSVNWKSLENCVVILTASVDKLNEVLPSLESQLRCLEKHLGLMDARRPSGNVATSQEVTESLSCGPQSNFLKSFKSLHVILVITKSDTIQEMMKQFGFKDQLSLLTLELRKLALKYGAALLFHSSVAGINLENLLRYVTQLTHPCDLEMNPEFHEMDSIFIPHSCDREQVVEKELQSFLDGVIEFNQPITEDLLKEALLGSPPIETSPSISIKEVVECERDQSFLASLQILLSKPLFSESSVESTESGVTPPPRRFSITPRRATALSLEASGALTHFFHNLLNSPSKGQTQD